MSHIGIVRLSLVAMMVCLVIAEGSLAAQNDPETSKRPKLQSPTIVDALHRNLGPVLGTGKVLLRIANDWFAARITYDAIRPFTGFNAYYTTTDCSGTAYLGVIDLPGNVVGFSVDGGPPFEYFYPRDIEEITLASLQGVNALGNVSACQQFIEPQTFAAGVLTEIEFNYQAPFTVR